MKLWFERSGFVDFEGFGFSFILGTAAVAVERV